MKKLFYLAVILVICQLAFGQAGNVPTCNTQNPTPGSCTDYFGAANWATSPLPTGTIGSFTVTASGREYTSPVVTIYDPTGTGAQATATITNGRVTGLTLIAAGQNYMMPQIVIEDPTGSGAMVTANLVGTFSGGLRKFIDPLKSLPVAVPDTVTFPGSDFYVIKLQDFTQKMHSDLPAATKLRGYVQINNGTDGSGHNTVAPPAQQYLGPVILAQKNRPVRVLFINGLGVGAAGNLFIPVDTTYMGQGTGTNGVKYTQNEATLHLHGGATPWISDGTPHQWTAPAGEGGQGKGDSVGVVPDMWFNSSHALIPACAGQLSCNVQGATNNPGPGSLTFYWTNEQGGRLMFYHDHAYGITRLNVYAGEVAGYLLADSAEENKLQAATAPGTLGSAPDLQHLIPLVIQDKSYVPGALQVGFQDPTWVHFGETPGTVVPGDLWYPHVYTTNQNPADPSGGNAFGRWDYGPWFFPPQNTLNAANPPSAVTISCTSAAFPGQTLAPTNECPTCGCPIIPNPSGTPEGFMDTPVVNGVAYPVLHVAPAAYRFQILDGANDRSWNLSWFQAATDPASPNPNTEVAMVPAVPPSKGSPIPLCSQLNPIAVQSLLIGAVGGLLDGTGNVLNGTGLPTGCWPNFGKVPGIPAPQTMWGADGRNGGVPDPRTAGPAWIQIGSEGGLLPTPAVIPSMPIAYEQNPRSITIGSVSSHGLWLGPAERADVIVDFSKFAGQTLILYNDAPTPAPAYDTRLDYFTGDGDQSSIGGAPNTQAGYGPNTRTIMQVVVDGNNPNVVPFSLPALTAAFTANAGNQFNPLFTSTQPPIIVPEAAYSPAYNQSLSDNLMSIQANTFSFNPVQPPANLVFDNACTATPPNVCAVLGQKAIQELFTLDYGRMNATLGVELPNTNFLNQTTIPYGYVDPPTEVIRQGQTQLWKITHNGVDSHWTHFHLFNVQVINRVGWDGSQRPIDPNEYGWKDVVRMNPLEDVLVALQPITPSLPFPVPDSIRPMDVTAPLGTTGPQFEGVNPADGTPLTVVNASINLGWEYVWHCHILGHEENDFMRPMIFQVAPPMPGNLASLYPNLTWTDNSASETSFTLQRANQNDPTFQNPVTFTVIASNSTGFSTPKFGQTITYHDRSAQRGVFYYYRVRSDDSFSPVVSDTTVGYPASYEPTVMSSAWTASVASTGPTVTFTGAPASANYGSQFVVTATTNSNIMPVITGTTGLCTVGAVTGIPASANATVTMLDGTGNCTLTATWPPNTPWSGALLTQTTAAAQIPLTVTASNASMTYGGTVPSFTYTMTGFINGDTQASSTAGQPTLSTPATPASPVGTYPINATLGTLTSSKYSFSILNGILTVNKAVLTVTADNKTMLEGRPLPVFTASYSGFLNGDTQAVLSGSPNLTTTATANSPVGNYPITPSLGSLSAANYSFTFANGTLSITTAIAQITTPAKGSTLPGSAVTFSWYKQTNATSYVIYVGSTPGARDITSVTTSSLSAYVPNVPVDGRQIYVTLYGNGTGVMIVNDTATYTAKNVINNAVITTPAKGSTFGGSQVAFGWTAQTGATSYVLYVGSTPGARDITSVTTPNLSTVVSNMPTDGRPIYVTLYGNATGTMTVNDTGTYTAASITKAAIATPPKNSTLSGSRVTFTWTAEIGGNPLANTYVLYVGSTPGARDINSITTPNLSATVNNMPVDGRVIYVTLYGNGGGVMAVQDTATYTAFH